MRLSIIIYVLFLIAAVCVYHPAAATDLDGLLPVETLWVEREEEEIVIGGKDVEGKGESWAAAMEDLEASAEGTVFLETVDRVVISVEAAACMEDLLADDRLRPSVQLYLLSGQAADALEKFTAAHESEATVENGKEPSLIVEEEGRYRIAGTEQGAA